MSTTVSKPTGASGGAGRGFLRRMIEQRELSNFLVQATRSALVLGLSFNGIMAVGMTVLLISGGFDLSVGASLALAGAVAGYSMTKLGVSAPLGIVLGLLIGGGVGLANGLIIAKIGVNPLIATLGMSQVARGIVYLLTSGLGIPNLPDSFNTIAQDKLLTLQYPIWILSLIHISEPTRLGMISYAVF